MISILQMRVNRYGLYSFTALFRLYNFAGEDRIVWGKISLYIGL